MHALKNHSDTEIPTQIDIFSVRGILFPTDLKQEDVLLRVCMGKASGTLLGSHSFGLPLLLAAASKLIPN